MRRDLLPGQVGGPAGGHDQQPGVIQVPGEVPQRLPGGGVGEMHVGEHGDHRRLAGQVPEHAGQPCSRRGGGGSRSGSDPRMTATRWNRLARSSSSPPHAATTCPSDLPCSSGSMASAHTPNARRHPERMSAREQAGRLRVAGEQLSAQAALAYPGLARQQDDTEFPAATRANSSSSTAISSRRPASGSLAVGIRDGPGVEPRR
jgi:hypothetical protein